MANAETAWDNCNDFLCRRGFISTPIPQGGVQTPFVEIIIPVKGVADNKLILRTGNDSSPYFSLPKNHAAIKSFSYGFGVGNNASNGFEVEIIDNGGVTYKALIHALNKSYSRKSEDSRDLTFTFGWKTISCDGQNSIITSPPIHMIPTSIRTEIDGSLIKIKLEGSGWDLNQITAMAQKKPEGNSEQLVKLKQAIENIMQKDPTKGSTVLFRNKDGIITFIDPTTGKVEPAFKFKNSDGGKDGPKSVWPTSSQNHFDCIRKWLDSVKTDNNLGMIMTTDLKYPSTLIIQEDNFNPKCCGPLAKNVGAYIVGGGKSSVISFNPQIEWALGLIPKGNVSSGANNAVQIENGDLNRYKLSEVNQDEGVEQNPTISQHELYWTHPEKIVQRTADAYAANIEANAKYQKPNPINAELVIIGDPINYTDPSTIINSTINILFINPYRISDSSDSWVSTSNCNSLLSNKNWKIEAVNHKVNMGSFQTTIKVMLDLPGTNTDFDNPIGGCGIEVFNADLNPTNTED